MHTSLTAKIPQEVQEVLNLTDTLIAIVKEETRLIQKRNYKEAVTFQNKKGELLNEYAQAIAIMKSNPSLKENLSSSEKKRLEDKAEELHQISILNEITITAAYETCQKIMVVVMDIAQKELKENAPYNRTGAFYKPITRAYSNSFGAISLDRRF
ncbi:hypothetical protein Bealeia1_00272 [Candidatus Bealeia paramacronuclearis]|uniref:Flagellar protein FlgN n=1 Tax=Candidatus Bealeia paramacronuclearis TaxID=1921001 RepID=A0ABZ2C1M5_9PROT|nr:hypothetical protein [Candidatus Bealeia paramacronuclearis]